MEKATAEDPFNKSLKLIKLAKALPTESEVCLAGTLTAILPEFLKIEQ